MMKDLLKKAAVLWKQVRRWKRLVDGLCDSVGYTSVPLWRPWRDY